MERRGLAWLGYLPIPGLALLAVLAAPRDRLVRYHAWQASVLVVGLLAVLILVGMLSLASEARAFRTILGLLSGLVMLAAFVQMGWGAVAAAQGRYVRLRPAWDVASLLRRA